MDKLIARLAFLCLLASFGRGQGLEIRYSIQYTGRTLGYARIPDEQTPGMPTASGSPNDAAEAYSKLFGKSAPEEPTLRLGMGDNFAPNLFGRTYKMTRGSSGRSGKDDWCPQDPYINMHVPKDRFFREEDPSGTLRWRCAKDRADKDTNDTSIDYDNVAQFFVTNKYNALVPGKHDFYLGPEWLRNMARMLAEHRVHLLGANLAISTVRAPQVQNTYPRIPDRYADLPYGTDFGPVSVDLPDMVFPYKQQFVIKNARQVLFKNGNGLVPPAQLKTLARKDVTVNPLVADVEICGVTETARVRDPMHIPLPDASRCMKLLPAETACAKGPVPLHLQSTCKALYETENGEFKTSADSSPATPDETYLFEQQSSHLSGDENYLFCVRLAGIAPDRWTCKPFSVQLPLFSYGLKENWKPVDPGTDIRLPFQVVQSPGLTIAVFGVVDPDLLSNVGLTNYSWLNNNGALDTAIKVAPADYTLRQALELCNARDECRRARKIVMAQMSWAKAGQLIARFGEQLDLAISQADDDHDTGNQEASGQAPAKTGPRLLITPPNPAPAGAPFTPKVSSLTFSTRTTPGSYEKGVVWSLHNRVDSSTPVPDIPQDQRVCASSSCMTVASAAHAALGAAKALTVPVSPQPLATTPSDDVRVLALDAMRAYKKTDLAFLQTRDLYSDDDLSSMPIAQANLQDQLQRIFWKGDFVIKLHVTGGTLRKIVKQSSKFAALDHDALSTEVERGRDLLTLGLTRDPRDSDRMYVNGKPLDDAALYSVAATEYLGLGDTGYSDLATPDVPPSYRIEDFENLRPIAGLVCAAIRDTRLYGDVKCDDAVLSARYFDPTYLRPFDETPGFDAGKHYTTFIQQRISNGSVPTKGVEGAAQQRGFLSLNLENLDVAYGGAYVNHVQTTGRTLAGITAPGVSMNGSNSIATDHRIRVIYDFRHGTFYGLSDSSFLRTSTTTSPVATLTSNMVGFEGGGTIRLLSRQRPAWMSLQYSSRFEGQLTDPSPTKVSANFFVPAPQLSTLAGRLGLRFEHADTYLETGLEEVDSRHILTQYLFSNGTKCAPSATLQLACPSPNGSGMLVAISDPSLATLATLPSPTVSTAGFLTAGAYLNFVIKFPLWSRRDASRADQSWYFTLSNHGDLYFNSRSDTGTQTRYLDKFTPAFSVPIYGKLALTPKVDFIFYENKIFHNHYRAVAPSLSLSYTFKWREGMNVWRAAGYGAITTPPSTAGSLPQK
jgi:hypothetical protein